MNDYSNRQVEFPNRIQLIKVPGTEDVYDFVWVPGRITNPGGTANEAFFKSIDDDIKAKLNISDKATQAQAEAGTDNTNYMTAFTVAKSKIGSKISVKTGTVNDGGTIPQTSGYEHYAYFVSPKMDSYTFVNTYNSYEISGSGFRIDCSVDQSTRKVTSKAYVEVRSSAGGQTYTNNESINANYIEIAWR